MAVELFAPSPLRLSSFFLLEKATVVFLVYFSFRVDHLPQVVGATGSTTIAFILPGLLYLKVHPEPHPKRSLATLQLAVGLLIIPVALTVIALGESPEGRR